ncbi:MAG: response regulator [Cytophagaceae bacterium]|nr:MAG: response regulator [Cytophagaceae bacterium]
MNHPVTQSGKATQTRPLLLVVEDNPDQWLLIHSALTQGFPEVEPIWVNLPAQALSYLESCLTPGAQVPILVLLDLYLPRREDGWNLLDAIKRHPRLHLLPIVVMSESEEQGDINQSYAKGIAAYQVKPSANKPWLTFVHSFRTYWWQTVRLLPSRPRF